MPYMHDPWINMKTRTGFSADELISALQKEIRRGKTENACLIGYELSTTSMDLEEYVWKRLQVISVEDVGPGNPLAPPYVRSLFEMYRDSKPAPDCLLFMVSAIRYLCESKKDRSNDELINWIIYSYEKEGKRPDIPEYALDMHTRKGKEMGRGVRYFYEEGTRVSPEFKARDRTFRDRLIDVLDKLD